MGADICTELPDLLDGDPVLLVPHGQHDPGLLDAYLLQPGGLDVLIGFRSV